jgi:hypothetical protein
MQPKQDCGWSSVKMKRRFGRGSSPLAEHTLTLPKIRIATETTKPLTLFRITRPFAEQIPHNEPRLPISLSSGGAYLQHGRAVGSQVFEGMEQAANADLALRETDVCPRQPPIPRARRSSGQTSAPGKLERV